MSEKMFPPPTEPVVDKTPPEQPLRCPASWCLLHAGHEGDCVVVPRKPIEPGAYGPNDPGWKTRKK